MARKSLKSSSGALDYHGGSRPLFTDGTNFYLVMKQGLTGSSVEVHKSTAPLSTWTQQDASGDPTGTYNSIAVQHSGTNIYVYTQGNGTPGELIEHVFSKSTDTWTTIDNSIYTGTDWASNTREMGCQIRSTGDRIVSFCEGEKVHGTTYDRAALIEWSGSSWGSVIYGGSGLGTTTNQFWKASCVGENDKVHLFVQNGSNQFAHQSLADGSTTLSAMATIYSGSAGTNSGNAIYEDDGGVESIKVTWRHPSSLNLQETEIRDDGTPSSSTASSTDPWNGMDMLLASDHPTSSRILATFSDNSTDDFWFIEDSGSGWSSDVEVFDAVTMDLASIVTYTNASSEYMLGVVYHDSTANTTYYDEYVLVTGGDALTIQNMAAVTAMTTPDLVQASSISVNGLFATTHIESFSITQDYGDLGVANLFTTTHIGSVTLTQAYSVVVSDLFTTTHIETFALVQENNLAVNSIFTTTHLGVFALVQNHNLVVDDWFTTTHMGVVTLAVAEELVVQNLFTTTHMDSFELVQDSTIVVDDVFTTTHMSVVILSTDLTIVVQSVYTTTHIGIVDLVQDSTIAVDDVFTTTHMESVVLVQDSTIAVDDVFTTTHLSEFAVVQNHNLAVDDWFTTTHINSVAVTQASTIAVEHMYTEAYIESTSVLVVFVLSVNNLVSTTFMSDDVFTDKYGVVDIHSHREGVVALRHAPVIHEVLLHDDRARIYTQLKPFDSGFDNGFEGN